MNLDASHLPELGGRIRLRETQAGAGAPRREKLSFGDLITSTSQPSCEDLTAGHANRALAVQSLPYPRI